MVGFGILAFRSCSLNFVRDVSKGFKLLYGTAFVEATEYARPGKGGKSLIEFAEATFGANDPKSGFFGKAFADWSNLRIRTCTHSYFIFSSDSNYTGVDIRDSIEKLLHSWSSARIASAADTFAMKVMKADD